MYMVTVDESEQHSYIVENLTMEYREKDGKKIVEFYRNDGRLYNRKVF